MGNHLKDHDIFLAVLDKPDAGALDFAKTGMDINNTQLLTPEKYKASDFIQKKFTENGSFNDKKFDEYYKLAQARYIDLTEEKILENASEEIQYGTGKIYSKKRDVTPQGVSYKDNPLGQYIGIEGDYRSDPHLSEKEAAQQSNIYDPIKKQWLTETAESRSLIDKVFGEPLAYAKYTKDTNVNPITGEIGNYKAGEFILNERGEYFTQLAGHLDPAEGHEIVKLQDILSDEKSGWNAIDCFDSDGLYKSPAGVAAKLVLSALPYFCGPYVKGAYTALNIMIGLGQTLPAFVKAFDGMSNNNRYTALSDDCNKIINYFERYKPSITQAGQDSFYSFENLGMLAMDTVNQLYSQRGVASLSTYLKKIPKVGKDAASMQEYLKALKTQSNIAKGLSKTYMTLISTGEVYNQAIRAGYDPRSAGLATVLSAGAMYGAMSIPVFEGMSTWMLGKNQGYHRNVTRAGANAIATKDFEELMKVCQEFVQGTSTSKSRAVLPGLLKKIGKQLDQSVRIGAEGLYKNMLAEGMEEITEEASMDAVKGLMDGLSYFGFKTSDHEGSFGGWSNVFSKAGLERYIHTFVGGALGGGLFHGIEHKLEPAWNKLWTGEDPTAKEMDNDLIDLYFNGTLDLYIDEVKNYVSKWVPDNLMVLPDENGNPVPNNEGGVSQRQFVTEQLVKRAESIKSLLDNYLKGANFDNISEDYREIIKQQFKPFVKKTELMDFFTKGFERKVKQMVEAQKNFQTANEQYASASQEQKPDFKEQKDIAEQSFKDALKQVKQFFEGENYVDNYLLGQILTNRQYLTWLKPNKENLSIETFYETLYSDGSVKYADLSPAKKSQIQKEYDLFVSSASAIEVFIDQAPVLLKTLYTISDIIAPTIEPFLRKSRNQIFAKKMREEIEVIQQELLAQNYEAILAEEWGEDWEKLDNSRKQALVGDRQRTEFFNIFSPKLMSKLIQANPMSMTTMERYQMDYAKEVADKLLDLNNFNGAAKKLIYDLINFTFAQYPLTQLTSDQLVLLLEEVKERVNKSPIWNSAIGKAQFGEDWNKNENPIQIEGDNLNDVAIVLDAVNKINELKTTELTKLGEDGLLEELYDDIVEYKQRVIAYIQELLTPYYNSAGFVIESIHDGQLKIYFTDINSFIGTINTANDNNISLNNLIQVLSILGVIDSKTTPEKLEQLVNDREKQNKLLNKIFDAVQRLYTTPDKRIDNPLRQALLQLSIATGTNRDTAVKIADWMSTVLNAIRDGKADHNQMTLPSDLQQNIKDIQSVFNMVRTAGKMMAPIAVQDGDTIQYYDSVNSERKAFAKSVGKDDSKIHTMSTEEYTLFDAILMQLENKLNLISWVEQEAIANQNEVFEKERYHMIDNMHQIYRELNSIGTQGGDENEAEEEETSGAVKSLFNFSEDLPDLSEGANLEQGYAWNLQYRSLLQQRILSILTDGTGNTAKEFGIQSNNRKDIVKYIFDFIYNKDDDNASSLFKYESDAVNASGGSDGNANLTVVEKQFLLVDLISLIPDEGTPSQGLVSNLHTIIQQELQKKGNKFYPRQDQLYNLELAVLNNYSREASNELIRLINEEADKDDRAKGRRFQIQNYVRMGGPAGSGKTALWDLYINVLRTINPNLKIVGTAHTNRKVEDLQNALDPQKNKNLQFKTLQTLIPELQDYQETYQLLERELLSLLCSYSVPENYTGDIIDNFIETLKDVSIKLPSGNEVELSHEKTESYFKINVTTKTAQNKEFKMALTTTSDDNSFQITSNVRYEIEQETLENIVTAAENVKDDLQNGVLLLDECTNLSTVEAQILSKLATAHNFLIFATGDTKQEGYSIEYKEKENTETHTVGDENFIGLNLPSLKSVYRAHNSGQQGAWKACRDLFSVVIPTDTFLGLDDYVIDTDKQRELTKKSNGVTINYTVSNSTYGFLGSLMTSQENQLDSTLEVIKEKDKRTVLGVVSKSENIELLKKKLEKAGFTSENITVELVKDIKGAEADYVIGYNIEASGQPSNQLERIYTMFTRGKMGAIIHSTSDWDIKFSYTEDNIYEIQRSRSANDAGMQWVEAYKAAAQSIKKDNSQNITGTKTLPTSEPSVEASDGKSQEELYDENSGLEITENSNSSEPSSKNADENNEEEENKRIEKAKELAQTYTKAFGDHSIMPVHPIGFRTSQSLNKIKESLKGKRTTALNDGDFENTNTPKDMHLVWQLLKAGRLNDNFRTTDEDTKVLNRIITEANAHPHFIEAYIHFINACREAVMKGELKVIAFHQTKYYDTFDIPYLKPNNKEQNPETLRRIGIPIIVNGMTYNGFITLATAGYFDTDNQSIKNATQELWERASNGIVVKQIKEDLTDVNDCFVSLYNLLGAAQNWYGRTGHKGCMRPVTGVRPQKLDPKLQYNQEFFDVSADQHQLQLEQLLNSGYTILPGEENKFVIEPTDVNNVADFTKFINKYRMVPLTEDQVREKFAGILKHSGVYYVVSPIGRSECSTFCYVNKAITWESWAITQVFQDFSTHQQKATGLLNKYNTLILASALTGQSFDYWANQVLTKGDLESSSPLTLSNLVKKVRDELTAKLPKEALNNTETQLAGSNISIDQLAHSIVAACIQEHFSTQVNNGVEGFIVVSPTMAPNLLKVLQDARSGGIKKREGNNPFISNGRFSIEYLTKNKQNFVFTSISSTASIEDETLFVGYAFEQERLLLDLNALEDFSLKTEEVGDGSQKLEAVSNEEEVTQEKVNECFNVLKAIGLKKKGRKIGFGKPLDFTQLGQEQKNAIRYLNNNKEQIKQALVDGTITINIDKETILEAGHLEALHIEDLANKCN